INRITPMLELANRKCVIISDADVPAKERQKKYKNDRGYGEWKRYDEINSTLDVITGEDFIKEAKLTLSVEKIKNRLSITTNPNFSGNKGKIHNLRAWLTRARISNEDQNTIIKRIKEEIFDDLKIADIEEKYFDFLKSFKDFLKTKQF
ncbi:unnamed protein product, partial [marine sediment metagenome]